MKAEALLSDISIGGLGLEKVSSMALKSGSIMTIKFNLGNIEANHPCTISWISHMEGRIGVSIRTNQKLQQALNREILKRQREVISKLATIGIPDTLLHTHP